MLSVVFLMKFGHRLCKWRKHPLKEYYRVDLRGDFLAVLVLLPERFFAEVLFFAERTIFFVDLFAAFLGTLPPA